MSSLRCFLPVRYVFAFVSFLGFSLMYAHKVVLSVTIVAMTSGTANDSDTSTDCGPQDGDMTNGTTPVVVGDYDWTSSQQSLVLGAFFYGYVATQIPAGRLAEKYGAKYIFSGGLLLSSIMSLFVPLAANWGVGALFTIRLIQGLGEGVTFPCMHALLARWAPKFERSKLGTLIYSGSPIGTVATLALAGLISDSSLGWTWAFYFLGIFGIVWFVLWTVLIYETPQRHPFISAEELEYIKTGQGEEAVHSNPPVPWNEILRSVPFWALLITHTGENWGFLTLLTELPTYLQKILHFNIKQNGLLSSLPYLAQAITSWIFGYVADKLRASGRVSNNVLRKTFNSISFFGPAICLLGVTMVGCDSTWTVMLIIVGLGFNGLSFSGFLITHGDMAPDYSGTLMGITNCIANFTGIIAPAVVAALTDGHQTLARWSIVFIISAVVFIVTGLIFLIWGDASLQPWGLYKKKSRPMGEANGVHNL